MHGRNPSATSGISSLCGNISTGSVCTLPVSFFRKSLVNNRDIEYNDFNYPFHYEVEEYILMSKNKKILLRVIAFLLVALIATGVVLKIKHDREMEALRIYNETYLVLDGVEYLRASAELDLSGLQITEPEKLTELKNLKKLNIRNTGISTAQYDVLRAGLPQCEILWSVPFQGGYVDDTVQELTLESLSAEDLSVFAYLPELVTVNADLCRDYDAIFALSEQYPELAVTYTVTIGGTTYPHTQDQIIVTDPDAAELKTQLALLHHLENVTLEGTLPDNAALIELKDMFPNMTFLWNFTVCGVETNTLEEFIDLSGIIMENTEELESLLPCFYNLKKVDMIKCGISDVDMEALNRRHPETKFVWTVVVGGVRLRTDTREFMPYKYGIKKIGSLYNLRYCTEIEVLDFGHKGISDLSYLEYMPNIRFLLLLECNITDLSIIGNCTSLKHLELGSTPIYDFWPLTNLTNLDDLNLSYSPFYYSAKKWGTFGDVTPLYQMTWLDRLWLAYSRLGDDGRAELRERLPNTELLFLSTSDTDKGWRYSPNYYEMRDILGMWYQIH